jgi:hypothetical protein
MSASRSILVLLLVTAGAACSHGADPAPAPGSAAGSSAGTGNASAAAPKRDYWSLLAAAKVPTLVGPFAKLQLDPGLTIASAREQAPELFEKASHQLEWFEYSSDELGGQVFFVERMGQLDTDPDTWLLGRLRVVAPPDLEAKLTAAWGPPKKSTSGTFWYDPAHSLRADLHVEPLFEQGKLVLDLQGYTPLAKFIGDDPKLFGFEQGEAMVGAMNHDVERRFGRRVFDSDHLELWPTELDPDYAKVVFAEDLFGDDAAFRLEYVDIEFHDDAKNELQALLAKKFHVAKPRQDEDGLVYRATSPRVTLFGSELRIGKRESPN